MDTQLQQIDALYGSIVSLVQKARMHVAQTANLALVYTNYEIGRLIVEREQGGEKRAAYGKQLLKVLANRLTTQFGKGFSYENLNLMRKFYLVYSSNKEIVSTVYPIQKSKMASIAYPISEIVSGAYKIGKAEDIPNFTLSWLHYLQLNRVEDPNARRFYEIEATKEQWSYRLLSRQIGSSLYERLALSRDKDAGMKLTQEGNVVAKPEDLLKEHCCLSSWEWMKRAHIRKPTWRQPSSIKSRNSSWRWEKASCLKHASAVSPLTRTASLWIWCSITACFNATYS